MTTWHRTIWGGLFGLFLLGCGTLVAQESGIGGTKLLRFPDIYGDQVVFSYAGDLWKGTLAGGDAVRLTAHEGLEMFPKFSPDGRWIAFTGQYDGDEQVYVIPSEGGVPKQLTYYPNSGPNPPRRGYDAQVMGWTPESNRVIFRSARDSNGVDRLTALYSVSISGALPEKLPMPSAGAGDLSPDGKRVVYSPLFRDFRHWKRYAGGWAQYLLIYDFENQKYEKIPTTERTDRDPMWVGDEVYFVSDRDGTLNLYRYVPATGETVQCTRHDQWNVGWASSDSRSRIVYELAGELRWYDTQIGEEKTISFRVPHDGLAMRSKKIDVSKNIESFELSPGGKRALFVARGDIFTVPEENGNTRNLTKSSGAHDRAAVWSKNGRWIAFISDRTGEDQVWRIDALGQEEPQQLTVGMKSRLDSLQWSPKGDALSFRDTTGRLWVLRETKNGSDPRKTAYETVEAAHDVNGGDMTASWSPDGRYLAYTLESPESYRSVHVWDALTGRSFPITDPVFDYFAPAWDPKGDWLYMLGQREYYPQISSIEWNFAGNRMDGLFAVALRPDVKNRFAPESDESPVTDESEKAKAAETKSDESASALDTPMPEIDFDGIASRVVRIPIASENYDGLSAAGDCLFYLSSAARFYGRDGSFKPKLMVYDLTKKKESVYKENVSAYAVSADADRLMTQSGSTYKISDAAAAAGEEKTVAVDGLFAQVVPTEEWTEIFNEVWRRYRDCFYVPNMHGYDWEKIGQQYRELLPFVAHRGDLTYLLTEMIAELSTGHTYVEGGDFAVPKRPVSGLAGAVFESDRAANRYRIAKIYRGQNEEPKYRSPLTEVGVNAAVGDYLLEIDGEELFGTDNPYRLLQNKTESVTWKISPNADGSDAREITYRPIESEASLRYLDFVLDAAQRVDEASGGRIGYLHLPNMGADGAYEFIKWYYPQLRKEGLIIDDRNNGGGNISSWIIARLSQRLLGTRFGRDRETPTFYPPTACDARLLCLMNETSASDGDIFPYYFRKAGLGPLVGKRTWGGVVGISGSGPLIDGGIVYVPLMATNDENGAYIIEGHGVDPDIEIWQDPLDQTNGVDTQLERGVTELIKIIDANPRRIPARPADPVKTLDSENHQP